MCTTDADCRSKDACCLGVMMTKDGKEQDECNILICYAPNTTRGISYTCNAVC